MKVRAIKQGFYNNSQVEVGKVFELQPIIQKGFNDQKEVVEVIIPVEDQYSEVWMEKVQEDVPLTTPKKVLSIEERLGRIEEVPEVKKYIDEKYFPESIVEPVNTNDTEPIV